MVRENILRVFGGSSRSILPSVFQLIFVSKTLELARSVDFTPHAVVRVARQQPFHISFAKFLQFPGVGYNIITLFGLRDTCRLGMGLTLNIDETHAANGVGRQARITAERRNIDASFPESVEQCRAIIYLDRPPIDVEFYHTVLLRCLANRRPTC
jgi:hypothetical protein